MKKKLRLVTVLSIKKHLETTIEELYSSIKDKNETEEDVQSLLETVDALEAQLIVVKEAVQRANQGRIGLGHTNNYYIFKYSNLLARKRFYQRIKDVDPDNCQISPDEAKSQIRKLDTELNSVSDKLTKFNFKKRVSIEVDTTLGLEPLLEEVK